MGGGGINVEFNKNGQYGRLTFYYIFLKGIRIESIL